MLLQTGSHMYTCKRTLSWVWWAFAASVQQPGALLHLRRPPESSKAWFKICCQLQQPCADKLKFALERHAGRTCHDEHYEILLLPYCCGVRTVCSEQIRSLINSVLFSRWQTRKGRAVVLHRFTLNKWFVCVVTVGMTPSHWGSQRSNQVLRFLVTAQLVSHLS